MYLQNYHKLAYGRTVKLIYDLTEHRISFDNKLAERNLRIVYPAYITGIKVKQKVSGCFRQYENIEYFARIQSTSIL